MLYMPAVAAMHCNPILNPFADRLRAAGKRGKQIIAAVMRRLLVLAYGVVRSGQAFDPEIPTRQPCACWASVLLRLDTESIPLFSGAVADLVLLANDVAIVNSDAFVHWIVHVVNGCIVPSVIVWEDLIRDSPLRLYCWGARFLTDHLHPASRTKIRARF